MHVISYVSALHSYVGNHSAWGPTKNWHSKAELCISGAVGPSKAKGRRSKLSDEPSIILHDQDGKREQLKWMDRAPIIVSCCHSIVYSLSSSGGGVAWRWAARAWRRLPPWQPHSEPAQRIVFKTFGAKSWLRMPDEAFFKVGPIGQIGRINCGISTLGREVWPIWNLVNSNGQM